MFKMSAPYLHDEALAHEFVQSVLWPEGPVCPHCKGKERITKVKANPEKRIRVGLWRCGPCKKQFTVRSAPSSRTATSS
jgi:transposase-like protein